MSGAEERIRQLEAMLEETPEDRDLRYFLATEYFGKQRYADALRQLEEYFRQGDDEGMGFKMRGICQLKTGRLEEARASLASGIAAARRHHHADLAAEIEETLEELFPA
jgi:thioredoxin-like negative regulator of GroEL